MMKRLVMATRPRNFDVMVIGLTGWGRIGEEIQNQGIPVIALGGSNGILLPWQLVPLVRASRRFRPDVVHCWMYHANLVGHALVWSKCGGRRPALITSVRGALHMENERAAPLRLVYRLDALLSKRSDAIVYNSQRAAEQHAGIGYCVRRSTVIPNCFDTEEFRPRPEEGARFRSRLGCESSPLVGLVARYAKEKDHCNFLQAARLVLNRVPDTRFLLAGKGCDQTNNELMRWVGEYGLSGFIHLLGERSDIGIINSALDVAVSSSLSEGFPNAIGEAMSCATPCVVTDVGDSGLLVGEAGLVVPPADPQALAEAVIRVVGLSGDKRRELGDMARRRVMSEFAMTPVIDRYVALYEKCAREVGLAAM